VCLDSTKRPQTLSVREPDNSRSSHLSVTNRNSGPRISGFGAALEWRDGLHVEGPGDPPGRSGHPGRWIRTGRRSSLAGPAALQDRFRPERGHRFNDRDPGGHCPVFDAQDDLRHGQRADEGPTAELAAAAGPLLARRTRARRAYMCSFTSRAFSNPTAEFGCSPFRAQVSSTQDHQWLPGIGSIMMVDRLRSFSGRS
jgi:hypothetical protein